jgi:hypothetical protein
LVATPETTPASRGSTHGRFGGSSSVARQHDSSPKTVGVQQDSRRWEIHRWPIPGIGFNGTLAASDTAPLSWNAGSLSYLLLASTALAGTADNLRFWNVALSDGQVAAL